MIPSNKLLLTIRAQNLRASLHSGSITSTNPADKESCLAISFSCSDMATAALCSMFSIRAISRNAIFLSIFRCATVLEPSRKPHNAHKTLKQTYRRPGENTFRDLGPASHTIPPSHTHNYTTSDCDITSHHSTR